MDGFLVVHNLYSGGNCMRILVLGGTRFFGNHLVESLLRNGHSVTIATRGIAKDSFGDSVSRIILDRNSRESIRDNLAGKHFDTVIDNICYSPNNTRNLLDFISTDRYVFTSSTAVYQSGLNIPESAFNPLEYDVQYGDRGDFSYDEGKRLCEAVAFQEYNILTAAVRFPVVIGTDDYTQRLYFYVDRIVRGVPIKVSNFDTQMSFITSEQAGEFLAFMCESDFTGSINACCDGVLSIGRIIENIEEVTAQKAVISENGEESAYNSYGNCTVSSEKSKALSFRFRQIEKEFCSIINSYRLVAQQNFKNNVV